MSPVIPFRKRTSSDAFIPAKNQNEDKYFKFALGGKLFAAKATSVIEVLIVPAIIETLKPPPLLVGVVNVRGNIIPVIDIRKRLGVEISPERSQQSKLTIFQCREKTVSMIVDRIEHRLADPTTNCDPGHGTSKVFIEFDDAKYHLFVMEEYLSEQELTELEKVKEAF